ncbi:hypothetical protein F53441_2609 [Fusarium austroafricanum]|uniref:Uncharacterized protein n=1 Tax=Fusarium austroafricanum TaxID=2364996 RepID=A0A8H4PBQ4_9HYPO|nr:hypothetical protein F53441_2609 [Fusarium austroafricanum]
MITQLSASVQDNTELTHHKDIVSYNRDVKYGIEHNFVTVLKKNGFTTQQAMDKAGELQDECYRRWYLALASMPTGRYLGAAEGYKLHETRLLDLSDLEPVAA